METTRGTLADFITEHHITASAEYADANPNMDDPRGDMRHWRVTLKAGRKRLTIPFSQGSAHTGRKTTLARNVQTEEEARAICKRYNDAHDPGFLSRKAEYQEQ